MKKVLCFVTVFLAMGMQVWAANGDRPTVKRVLMIGLDGLSVEGLEKAGTPNLDSLFKKGGALSVTTRAVMPSITLPNWTTMLSGSGPEQHGVCDNSWTVKNFRLPAIETDPDGYYPTLFTVLRKKIPGIKFGYYYNWKNLVNSLNTKLFDDRVFLDKDAFEPNCKNALAFMKANRDKPTVVFLYQGETDNAGHRNGWKSQKYLDAIHRTDGYIGELLKAMKQEGLYEDTYFFLLSDHGGIGRGHGGIHPSEMNVPWGISGPGIKKGFTITEPNNQANTASTILYLFGVEQPLAWIGEVPYSVFEKKSR